MHEKIFQGREFICDTSHTPMGIIIFKWISQRLVQGGSILILRNSLIYNIVISWSESNKY